MASICRDGCGAGDVEKKNEWEFVGEVKGCWLEAEQKVDILVMIESAKTRGISVTRDGWEESNINILTDNSRPYSREIGSPYMRGLVCKVYKC
jgi:hypothetical protein